MKGFIERIEGDNVYCVFEDDSTRVFKLRNFSEPIAIDMQVEVVGGRLVVSPPDEKLAEQIKEITDQIFVPFKGPKRKK